MPLSSLRNMGAVAINTRLQHSRLLCCCLLVTARRWPNTCLGAF